MKIAPDKWKHFFVGIVMGAVLQVVFFWILNVVTASVLISLLFSVVVGYGFELYSKFTGKGHYEVLDAVAAVVGACVGIALAFVTTTH